MNIRIVVCEMERFMRDQGLSLDDAIQAVEERCYTSEATIMMNEFRRRFRIEQIKEKSFEHKVNFFEREESNLLKKDN